MTIQIPNEVGTTLAGTPSPALIATESADNVNQAGLADHVQQETIINMISEISYMTSILSKNLSKMLGHLNSSGANASGMGSRLRAVVESISFAAGPRSPVYIQSGIFNSIHAGGTTIPQYVGSASNFNIHPGKPDTIVPDTMKSMSMGYINSWRT